MSSAAAAALKTSPVGPWHLQFPPHLHGLSGPVDTLTGEICKVLVGSEAEMSSETDVLAGGCLTVLVACKLTGDSSVVYKLTGIFLDWLTDAFHLQKRLTDDLFAVLSFDRITGVFLVGGVAFEVDILTGVASVDEGLTGVFLVGNGIAKKNHTK